MQRTTMTIGLMAATLGWGCGDDVSGGGDEGTTSTGLSETTGSGSVGSTGSETTQGDVADDTTGSGSTDDDDDDDDETSTGSPEPDVCPPAPYTRVAGDTVGGLTGWGVTFVGDFDGDGTSDYAVSTPRADGMLTTDQGRVHVVRGGPNYDDFSLSDIGHTVEGWIIDGEESNHRSGEVIVGAHDVNGDGLNDLMLGSIVSTDEVEGRWSIVYGRELDSTRTTITLADVRLGNGGFAIDGRVNTPLSTIRDLAAGVGDVNDDGFADVLFGSPLANGLIGPGYVDLIWGGDDLPGTLLLDDMGLDPSVGVEFFSPTGFSGFIIGGGGDVNGDGIDDILFGTNPGGTLAVYVAFGGEDLVSRTLEELDMGIGGFVITPEFDDVLLSIDEFADIVPDVNGDGLDDVVFGVQTPLPEDGGPSGAAILFGKTDGDPVHTQDLLEGHGGFVSTRASGDDNVSLGRIVGGAGDMNGDGIGDLFVTAEGDPYVALNTGEDQRGRVYVVYGYDGMNSLDLGDIEAGEGGWVFQSPEVNDGFGQAADGRHDVNGDGIADLLVGAPFHSQLGATYVVYGFNEDCPQVR